MSRCRWMVLFLFLVAGCPVIAESESATPVSYLFETVNLRCDPMGQDVPVRILAQECYDWDDEIYTQLIVMDSRSDEEISGLVADFVSANEDLLPAILIRLPECLLEKMDVKEWMSFLDAQVFPYVEKHYRTRPFRILVGNMVTAEEALVVGTHHHAQINGVVALGLSKKPLAEKRIAEAVQSFTGQTSKRLALFMVGTDEASQMAPFTILEKELQSEKNMRVRLVVYNAGFSHGKEEQVSLLQKGLAFCYSDWFVRDDLKKMGIKGLAEHYRSLSKLTGVEIVPPESILDRLAFAYQMSGQNMLAIDVLKYNVRLRSRSAEGYAAIGEGWFKDKRFRAAIMRFKQAVSIARETNNPQLAKYQAMLKNAYEQIDYMQGVGLTEGGTLQKVTGGLQ